SGPPSSPCVTTAEAPPEIDTRDIRWTPLWESHTTSVPATAMHEDESCGSVARGTGTFEPLGRLTTAPGLRFTQYRPCAPDAMATGAFWSALRTTGSRPMAGS